MVLKTINLKKLTMISYFCFRSAQRSGGAMLSRSRTFYTNSDNKPNSKKKSFEYKSYKNNFYPSKNTQQKDNQVIFDNYIDFIIWY